jgi:hypothetical protein
MRKKVRDKAKRSLRKAIRDKLEQEAKARRGRAAIEWLTRPRRTP